jgi:hypothetical protein
VLNPGCLAKAGGELEKERQERIAAEKENLRTAPEQSYYPSYGRPTHSRQEILDRLQKLASTETEVVVTDRLFEHEGIDVRIRVALQHKECPDLLGHLLLWTRIELKPSVGDDYPSVLRQMLANRSQVLVLDQYTGKGATREQFVRTFQASGKRVVFLSEIRGQNGGN